MNTTHHHGDLQSDLDKLLAASASRRQSLRWLFASAAAVPLYGCGGGSGSAAGSAATTTPATTTAGAGTAACTVIPEETGGPYPADGTNSANGKVANALTLSGIVRPDIRWSVAGASGVAMGVPLTIRLKIVNVANSCANAAGATVYLWHCDRDGNYSMYASAISAENYLRGVQEADADGIVTFTTIFPGCYDGRMPHVHFEVYPTLVKATSAANRVKTSQFTFPLATCNEVYTATGYAASVRNLARISYASDNVFADGTALQMAAMSGDMVNGYVATLTVGVSL
ncbi:MULTISPECIES: intradiol ring-cleavage dioxygenase [unclassified Massilia]|uniref:dioxygenase family protein n=1 Tax=unclassified Massilia TaxID=2609279 RepID=UPI001781F3F0|nr:MULTISPECIES: intradiol ring-cleavage dioxygenase [unclassified Massilia]MBD8529414.1 intradiol ring-cleavage dioxygenase [Massilia sp. CFBP 13647]MBD8672807.1 intradiol ring-cleavage dioxygenase [Massilia sp. CFBP 13721]